MSDELSRKLQAASDYLREFIGGVRANSHADAIDAAIAALGGVEPVAWTSGIEWSKNPRHQSEQVLKLTRHRQAEHGFITPLYALPAAPSKEG